MRKQSTLVSCFAVFAFTAPNQAANAQGPAPTSAPVAEPLVEGKPGSGLTVKVDDRFSLNVRSRFQLRYQLHIPEADASGTRKEDQTVNIGTARIWLGGNVYFPELTYTIQLAVAGRDYRDGATSPIYDAFLDWKVSRDVNVRAGQFFVPFDRLRTVREWALQLADRPRPVGEFTLDRDVGVVVFSEHFLGDTSPLAYRLGAFGGGGTNLSNGREPGGLFVGRLELRPLGAIDDDVEGDLQRYATPRVAVGVGVAANRNTNRLRSTTGPTFVGGTTDYLHAAADVVFKWRGLALQVEYLLKRASATAIRSTDTTGAPRVEPTRAGDGWVVQASYILASPVEFVGRYSRIGAKNGTDPLLISEVDSRGQELVAGVNYYFNGHRLKLQADYVARMPVGTAFDRADHVAHLQLDATF